MSYSKPNYTQVPNLLLDEHMQELNAAELKIVLAVCRQTFGYHKEKDLISLRRLEQLTGLGRSSICEVLPRLLGEEEEPALICREPDGQSYTYHLVLDGEEGFSSGFSTKLSTEKASGPKSGPPNQSSGPKSGPPKNRSGPKSGLVTYGKHVRNPDQQKKKTLKKENNNNAVGNTVPNLNRGEKYENDDERFSEADIKAELCSNGVIESVASGLIRDYGLGECASQLAHLYYLASRDEAPSKPAAWLVAACKHSYNLPDAVTPLEAPGGHISDSGGKGRDEGAAPQVASEIPDWRAIIDSKRSPVPRTNRHQAKKQKQSKNPTNTTR